MTKMLTMRLTDENHARLQAQAKKEYTSMAGLLMRLFDQYMDKSAPKPEAKDDGRSHLREAYDAHVASLTREIILDEYQRPAWQNKLANIQKAWGKDGAIVLPFPTDRWNELANPAYTPSAVPQTETLETIEADLKKLFSDFDE